VEIKYLDEQQFMNDFQTLIIELECGRHYDSNSEQHVQWLKRRVHSFYINCGTAICLYSDAAIPIGFLFLIYDHGLEGVECFGTKASIAMFGLFPEYRSNGLGASLLREAEEYVTRNGGKCLYVDTYAGNAGAIRYYTREGFIPVAYHPGENGMDDKGQVYLFKELC